MTLPALAGGGAPLDDPSAYTLQTQQLGRYHLLDRIAIGGMAEIYRAKTFDARGGVRLVAIKRLLAQLAEDDDFLQMLVDEAKIASILDHPNIARVYELARYGDDYFLAMEYVDGPDLRGLLERCRTRGQRIAVSDAIYIAIRALEALHAAHQATDGLGNPLGIVHRDVSPSNIMVSYQGQVKLCDFGIAKARLSRIQTRTGVIKGKVRYMSPEQALGRKLDHRSDLFSLGSVLYELLTMQPPFEAETEMALIFRVRDAKYTKPSRVDPTLPAELDGILRGALTRSPGARYGDAEELCDRLRQFLDAISPDYRPSRLGRFVRTLYAELIEEERELLEQFVLGETDPSDVGHNLIAEVLGHAAQYTQFSPLPRTDPDGEPEAGDDADRTRLMPRLPAPEERLPRDVDLHDLQTQILDVYEPTTKRRRRRRRPGRLAERSKRSGADASTKPVSLPRDPDHPTTPPPEELHDAPTRILHTASDDDGD